MSENRISQITVATTGQRQTPKNEFGQVLVQTSKAALDTGGALLGAFASVPVMTAAVSGVKTVLGLAAKSDGTSQSTQTIGGSSGGAGTGTGHTEGYGGAMEAAQLQAQLQAEGFQLNAVYMGLQREMQRESREYTALSNVMKVRHDTAKAAINNVR